MLVNKPRYGSQPKAPTRLLVFSIAVSFLLAGFSSFTLLRLMTLADWNITAVAEADRLQDLPYPLDAREQLNGSGQTAQAAFLRQARQHAQKVVENVRKCFDDVLEIEWWAARAVGAHHARAHCDVSQAGMDRINQLLLSVERNDLSVPDILPELRKVAQDVQVASSAIQPHLKRYTVFIVLLTSITLLVVMVAIILLVARQLRVISRAQHDVEQAYSRLGDAVESIGNGFAIYDPNGVLVTCNDAYRKLSSDDDSRVQPGARAEDIIRSSIRRGLYGAVPPEREDAVITSMQEQAASPGGLTTAFGDGFVRVAIKTSTRGDRVVTRVDQTEFIRREEEAALAARTDALTGLPNRRHFDEVAKDRSLNGQIEEDEDILVRIDLDNFKQVNDSLGHEAGDLVLQKVAGALRESCRENDFVARLGGDEFLILLERGTKASEVDRLINRIVGELSIPITYNGQLCRFTASFGVASSRLQPESMLELLSFADVALYEAKRKGRGRTEHFTEELLGRVKQDRLTASELAPAIERGELIPFLQPQIDAGTRRLVGFEVLARWQHPRRGLLLPNAFLDVAEKLRLVPDVDRAIFDAAMGFADMVRQIGAPIPRLSFNVSAGRLRDPELAGCVSQLIERGVPVTLEVLESIAVEDEALLREFEIDVLREVGARIEIDDFGSGHASIVGVMALKPDGLKIDRRIVTPMLGDAQSERLVKAVVDIAKSLGIATVAEGVESLQHAKLLADLGVETLQGYAFARPMPIEEAVEFIALSAELSPRHQST